MNLGIAWARFTTRHSNWVLVFVLALTLFFAFGLTRIRFGSQILDFHRQESRELIRTIEEDFQEGNYLTLIFELKQGRKSLLEPDMLHRQFNVLQEIKKRFPVDTFSLVDAVDQGLRRLKGKTLLEVHDYTSIAEGILALAGGRNVWDLEKVSRNLLSQPEAIGFYTRLRLAGSLFPRGPMQRGRGTKKTVYLAPRLRAMKAFVQFEGSQDQAEKRRMAIGIRDLAASFADQELNIHSISDDLIAAEIDERTTENIVFMALIVMSAACLLFWVISKRGREVLIPLILMGTSLVWTFGLAGFLGFRLAFLHLLVVPILLGTGNDDAFVFGRQLLEERRGSSDLPSAVERTFTKTGKAIFLTTFTTFVAFGVSAWMAESQGIQTFNLLVAFSMAIVFLLTVLLQGPLRVWMGERETSSQPEGSFLVRTLHEKFMQLSRNVGKLSFRYLSHNRGRVLWISLFVALAASGLSLGLESEFSRDIFLRPTMQTARANAANRKYFGRADHGYLLIEGQVEDPELLRNLDRLEKALFRYPLIQKVLRRINVDSITELVRKLYLPVKPGSDMRELFDRIAENRRTANFALNETFQEAAEHRIRKRDDRYDGLLVKFFVTGGQGDEIRAALDQMTQEIDKLGFGEYRDVRIRLGGGDLSYHVEEAYFFASFAKGFFLSLGLNFLVLMILWRRWTLSLMAMFPLLLSLAVVLGSMVLFGVDLNVLNLCIGAIVVGVGIDYPIHVIERYCEEKRHQAVNSMEAIKRTLESVGPSVWAGALTTIAGFSACTVLAMPVAVSFGLLMAWAVTCVYLASIFILPALLVRGQGADAPFPFTIRETSNN